MTDKLFQNVGESIKELAKDIFWGLAMPWILSGIALAIGGIASGNIGFAIVGAIVALIIISIGVGRAKQKVLFMYGFGVIVERLDHLQPSYFVSEGKTPGVKSGKNDEKNLNNFSEFEVEINVDGTWECPFCGQRNPARVKNCQGKDCGVCVTFRK